MRIFPRVVLCMATTALFAQLPQGLDLQALKQAASAQGVTGAADTEVGTARVAAAGTVPPASTTAVTAIAARARVEVT